MSERLTFGVILIELALYHLYKVGRRDYVLWIAGFDGALKYMCAFFVHSVVKVLVDYTGMIHCRGPKLAGGALFTFQTIVSQCYPFVALHFYKTSDIEYKADVDMLKMAFIILASSWFLCVLAFLKVTKKEVSERSGGGLMKTRNIYAPATRIRATTNPFAPSSLGAVLAHLHGHSYGLAVYNRFLPGFRRPPDQNAHRIRQPHQLHPTDQGGGAR